jgi:hypothetical protein
MKEKLKKTHSKVELQPRNLILDKEELLYTDKFGAIMQDLDAYFSKNDVTVGKQVLVLNSVGRFLEPMPANFVEQFDFVLDFHRISSPSL